MVVIKSTPLAYQSVGTNLIDNMSRAVGEEEKWRIIGGGVKISGEYLEHIMYTSCR